jgi:hypothetical protein
LLVPGLVPPALPNAIWYETLIPGVATRMATTSAEVTTAKGSFGIIVYNMTSS